MKVCMHNIYVKFKDTLFGETMSNLVTSKWGQSANSVSPPHGKIMKLV